MFVLERATYLFLTMIIGRVYNRAIYQSDPSSGFQYFDLWTCKYDLSLIIFLRYELKSQSNQPHLLGASVLGPDDVHKRLKEFKANLPRDSKGNLYVLELDLT